MTKLYTTATLLLLLLFACKSPQKVYDQGNYNQAIERAVKKLQRDPNDAAAGKVAKEAYGELVAMYESDIRNLLSSTDDNRFAQVYRRYGSLQNLYQTIRQSPAAAS